MDTSNVFSLETTTIISGFALAWFIVGILVGKSLPRRRLGHLSRSGSGHGETGDIELYVGNLSYDVTEKDLFKAFEVYGKVTSGRIIQNRFNGKSKGYGFVEMSDRNEAVTAIRALNGKEVKGRRIVVNEAKSSPRG